MSNDVILQYLSNGLLRNEVCRICVELKEDLTSLTKITDGAITLQDMLLSITSLQIDDNDSLPQNVCNECFEKISNCYAFRLKCEDADSALRNAIKTYYHDVVRLLGKSDLTDESSLLIVCPDEVETQSENNIKTTENLSGTKTEDEQIVSEDDVETIEIKNEYFCTFCLIEFKSSADLQEHGNWHLENKNTCIVCFKIFSKPSFLKRHLKTHTENEKFICDYCEKCFNQKTSLVGHILKHTSKKFRCKICLQYFNLKSKIVKHLDSEHNVEYKNYGDDLITEAFNRYVKKEFNCTMCEKTFKMIDELLNHKRSHPPGTKHLCRVCGRKYLYVTTLRTHMIKHDGVKNFSCQICGKEFFYKNVLKNHMIYHGKKEYGCQLCEKFYHTPYSLQEHVRVCHTDQRYQHMCEHCGHLSTSLSNLILHRRIHNIKQYCYSCGKGYKNDRYFQMHLKIHEQNDNPNAYKYICDYCGEGKNLKVLIERHILSKHLFLRNFVCKECGKAFHTKGGLTEHSAVHRKEKLSSCHVCGQKLVNHKALLVHMRLHTGEKPYSCLYCKESFISTTKRMIHMKKMHAEALLTRCKQ